MTIREYHDLTRYTPERVGTSGPPDRLEWSNRPLPYKRYLTLRPIDLPADLPASSSPAVAALSGQPAPARVELDLQGLARLLFFSAGVTRRWRRDDGVSCFRAAPSAGARYPIEVYVVCGDLPGLAGGVYHFEPAYFVLRRLRDGDLRGTLAAVAAHPGVARAPVTFALTGIPWRTTWQYGARGYRHLFWDAGAILANLLALAAGSGLPTEILVGFADGAVTQLLGLGGTEVAATGGELPLALAPVGPPGEPARPTGPLEDLDLQVERLSRRPLDEPALRSAHHAGDLGDAEEVAAWRARAGGIDAPEAAGAVPLPPDAAHEPIEDVILRRGSTRRFSHEPAPRALLDWGLAVAAGPVPGDFVGEGRTLLTHLIAVHAVDGVQPGVYRWAAGAPRLLGAGASREETAFLCLDQPLGGDAAATVFHTAELDPILEAAGDRGYRSAQLEAGIAAGRLQLAAFTLGVGGSGITFYDDEVRRFFDTAAEPMLSTAVGVPAYRSRPGRRPVMPRC